MTPPAPFRLGACMVDPSSNTIRGAAGETRLPPRIMKVLVCLAEHAPETASRETLLARGWPAAPYVADEALTRAVSDLRKALRHVGCREAVVRTVPKVGYRLGVMPVFDALPDVLPETLVAIRRREDIVSAVRPRRGARMGVAAAFLAAAGLGFFMGAALTALADAEVRVQQRVMAYPASTDAEALPLPARLDTLLVGADARRLLETLAGSNPAPENPVIQVRRQRVSPEPASDGTGTPSP